MQTFLIKLGYLNSYADGDFGSVTEIAVKNSKKKMDCMQMEQQESRHL